MCVLDVLNLFICIEYSFGFCYKRGLVVWSPIEVCPSLPGSWKKTPAAPQISDPQKAFDIGGFSSKDEIYPIQVKGDGYSEYLPDLGETTGQ